MDTLLDNISRTLATPMPRRKALGYIGKLLGAAVLAGFAAQPVDAAGCTNKDPKTSFSCGNGSNASCCPADTCCAALGNTSSCCAKGKCKCNNGTCASSTSGKCPSGCSTCV
jgi:hypothetical protein